MKSTIKRGRPRLSPSLRTVWLSARLTPKAAELLQDRVKATRMSTGKVLSQILVTLYDKQVTQ